MKPNERLKILCGAAALIAVIIGMLLLYEACEHDGDRRTRCIEQTHDAAGCLRLLGDPTGRPTK